MNILSVILNFSLLKGFLVYSYRLKFLDLELSSAPKKILLKPTHGTRISPGAVTIEGGPGNIGAPSVPFGLPNTLSLNGKFSCTWPVLGVDLGTQSVGVSFNRNGEFELFEALKFVSYRKLTAQLLGLIRHLKRKYLLDWLVVCVGFPFPPLSGGATSSVFETADLRILFQILFTLDFSCYFSHYLDKVFNKDTTANTDDISTKNHPSLSHTDNTVATRCLYCSIFGAYANHADVVIGSGTVGSNPSNTSNSTVCRISGKNCVQTVGLANMSHFVMGASEHLSTYQTSSVAGAVNPANGCVNGAGGSKTGSGDDSYGLFLNSHSLSSLNIYYNLLSTAPSNVTGTPRVTSGSATNIANIDHTHNNSNTSATNNISGTGQTTTGLGNFLVLPNRTNVFNANSKQSNILLYRRIKAHLLSNTAK